jgi:hypothetical protein
LSIRDFAQFYLSSSRRFNIAELLEQTFLHWFGDEISLRDVAADSFQRVPFRLRFHAFADALKVQAARHLDARLDDGE